MPTARGRYSRATERAFVAAVILAAALAVGAPLYFFLEYVPSERRETLAALSSEFSARTDQRQMGIERWVQEAFEDATTVAEYPPVQALLAQRGAPRGATANAKMTALLTLLARTQHLKRVLVVDERAQVVVAGHGSRLLAPAETRLLRTATISGRPTMGFHRNPVTGGADVAFVVPVKDASGHPVGAVLLEADPEEWVFPFLVRTSPLSQRSSEAVLVELRGDSVVWVSPRRKSTALPLTDRRLLSETRGLPLADALRGASRFGAYIDYHGDPVYASTRPIRGTPWGLIVKVDQADILGPFRAQMRREAAGWGLALVALLGLAATLWRNARRALALEVERGLARQTAALDQANDIVLFLGLDGRIEGANRQAEKFYGGSPGALVGRHVFDLRPPEDRAAGPGQFAAVRDGGEGLVFETVHLAAGTTPVPVEVSSRRVHLEGGDQIVSVIRDVRERRASEERIARLNRALRTIAEIDALILRETSAERLFAEACRVLVEHGGFRMAWIGVAEPDGSVRPAAQFGPGEGYLALGAIRWDDTPHGRGPTGIAVREGRTVACNDIATDPALAPWREGALARGFRSSMACPIRAGGRAGGVLTVYADQPGVFDDEMDALFGALSSDLGFALQALEDHAERERAEQDLRQRERSFRVLFDSNPLCMWVYGLRSHRFLAVNDAAVVQYGWSREEFLTMTLEDIRPPEDVARLREDLSRPRPTLQRSDGWRHRRRNNSPIDVEILSHVIVFEGREAVLVSALDVTERKRAEAAVRLSEGQYRSLFHGMLEGYAHCRMEFDGDVPRDWVYLDVNPAFGAITGLTGVVGKRVTEIVPGIRETNPEMFEIFGRVARTGAPSQVESYVPALGIWFSLAVYRPAPGEFVAVFEDITERRRAFEEVRRLNTELETRVLERTAQLADANRELEAFAYSVSHDLRAPLRAIDGYGRMLEEDHAPRLDDEGRRLLNVVRSSTKGMGQLIDDLLAFSRAGHGDLVRARVDMTRLARDVWTSLATPAEVAGVTFRLDALPEAESDPTLMRQVWVNLLSNALKFTRGHPAPAVAVGARIESGRAVYFVQDNGVGFDPRYRDKLFGVFQRLHSATKFEGTGVGLALVQRIVTRHGGTVWADGAVGEGATFHFTLPAKGDS